MSACNDCDEKKKKPCMKCKKDTCRCKRPKDICHEDGCEQKIPAECVIYKPKGGTSYLNCFLGISSKTNLEEILETLDDKLCDAFTLNLPSCIVDKIGLNSREVDYKVFLNKLATYICEKEDKFVKVSPTDTKSGYLFDKIQMGECLDKRIIANGNGEEKVEIFLNFECIKDKLELGNCLEVDCGGNCGGGGNVLIMSSNTNSICGSNLATLKATSTSFCSTIEWYRNNVLIATNTNTTLDVSQGGTYHAICKNGQENISISNSIVITKQETCPCVSNVWSPTGNTRCQDGVSQIERRSNCNVYEWIPGGNACSEPCNPVWTDKKPLEIYCGGDLNTRFNTTQYDKCKIYQAFSNQCNSDIMWYPYPKNPDGSHCTECNSTPTPVPTPTPTPIPVPVPVATCTIPDSLNLTGNFTPYTGSTHNYFFTKVGGTANNTILWSVVGGTIQGSATGNSVQVLWDNNTILDHSVTLTLGCAGQQNTRTNTRTFKLVEEAPNNCGEKPTIDIVGDFAPLQGSTKTYSFTRSNSNANYNTITWSVLGGTVIGASNQNTVSVQWTADSETNGNIMLSLGCTLSELAIDSQAVNIVNDTEPPVVPGCGEAPTMTISGATSPIAGSTQTYTFTRSNSNPMYNSIVWTALGGTIIGSQYGNTLTVQWSTDPNVEGLVTLAIWCGLTMSPLAALTVDIQEGTPNPTPTPTPVPTPIPVPTPVPVPVETPVPQPIPVPVDQPTPTPVESCVVPASVSISGNLSPMVNSTESYNVSISGGSEYTLTWTAGGGTIVSGQGTANVTIQWDNNTTDLHNVGVSAGCPNLEMAMDIEFFNLQGGTPTPQPVPTPVPVPVNEIYCAQGITGESQVYTWTDCSGNTTTGFLEGDLLICVDGNSPHFGIAIIGDCGFVPPTPTPQPVPVPVEVPVPQPVPTPIPVPVAEPTPVASTTCFLGITGEAQTYTWTDCNGVTTTGFLEADFELCIDSSQPHFGIAIIGDC